MGVSGSGKSTVGRALSDRLHLPFCEGDELHPEINIALMRAGVALDDDDREPWLARINAWLQHQTRGGIVSCSALKRAYRERLGVGLGDPIHFVLLDPAHRVILQRLRTRADHFMPASLLDSQLKTLERPGADECSMRLTGAASIEVTVDAILAWLRAGQPGVGS